MNKSFERIRVCDTQEILHQKMHKNTQVSREWAFQQGELVKQLQARINSIENTTVDMNVFQTKELEVCEKLVSAQQTPFTKVEAIQNHFQVVNQSLNNVCLKEREAIVARSTFQEAVVV